MWEIVADVIVEKIFEDTIGQAIRREVMRFDPGRIPSRLMICNKATALAQEFFNFLHETVDQKPYDYGDVLGCSVKSVTWIPL